MGKLLNMLVVKNIRNIKENLIYDSISIVEYLPYVGEISMSNMWFEVFLQPILCRLMLTIFAEYEVYPALLA